MGIGSELEVVITVIHANAKVKLKPVTTKICREKSPLRPKLLSYFWSYKSLTNTSQWVRCGHNTKHRHLCRNVMPLSAGCVNTVVAC